MTSRSTTDQIFSCTTVLTGAKDRQNKTTEKVSWMPLPAIKDLDLSTLVGDLWEDINETFYSQNLWQKHTSRNSGRKGPTTFLGEKPSPSRLWLNWVTDEGSSHGNLGAYREHQSLWYQGGGPTARPRWAWNTDPQTFASAEVKLSFHAVPFPSSWYPFLYPVPSLDFSLIVREGRRSCPWAGCVWYGCLCRPLCNKPKWSHVVICYHIPEAPHFLLLPSKCFF